MDEKALEKYLIREQLPDGSWGSGDPFTCSRILLALRDAMPEDTLARGLKYLENTQAQDGHFAGKTRTYSDASNTAYTMTVLNRFDYGKASMPISRGILWLLENQHEDGSWGPNAHKKVSTTTFCLRALHTFYLSGIQRFARGLDYSREYLKALRFESEVVSHVYAPVLNMQRIGYLGDLIKDEFIEYAWTATQDAVAEGRVPDAAMLLGTLKAVDEEEIAPVIAEWLVAVQNDDGGFGRETCGSSDPATTALVALSLKNQL